MAKLTTSARKAMPKSEFALPARKGAGGKNAAGRGAFPIENKSHARAAMRDAPHAEDVGDITKSQERTVERKARAKLGETDAREPRTHAEFERLGR